MNSKNINSPIQNELCYQGGHDEWVSSFFSKDDTWSERKGCIEAVREGNFTHLEKIVLSPGFEIFIFDCMFRDDTIFSFQDTAPLFSFAFYFSGQFSWERPSLPDFFNIGAAQTQSFCYYPYSEGISKVCGGCPLKRMTVCIAHEQFQRYFDVNPETLPLPVLSILEDKSSECFSYSRPLAPLAFMLLDQIRRCPFEGATRKHFFEGTALNLAALQLHSLGPKSGLSSAKLLRIHPMERKRLEAIRTSLLDRLEFPPSLMDLSREAAMSASRLNQCFRQLYGVTVFEYLRQERFHRARQMLEQGLNVTEAALSVGYSSPNTFARSFKKLFGYSPSRHLPSN